MRVTRAINVRTQMMVAICLVALLPLVLSFVTGSQALNQVRDLSQATNREVLSQARIDKMHKQAEMIVQQMDAYISSHPEIDLGDLESLQRNAALASIALRPFGQTGFNVTYDQRGRVIFHSDPKMVGTSLVQYDQNDSQLGYLFSLSMRGTPAEGDFDWPDADGFLRSHYLIAIPVGSTSLHVALATSYRELEQPYSSIATRFDQQVRDISRNFILITLAATVAVSAIALLIGRAFAAEILTIKGHAVQALRILSEPMTSPDNLNEVEYLQRVFLKVTRLVLDLRRDLEKQVTLRTVELSRWNSQTEAAARIAQEVARIPDFGKLLDEVPILISKHLGYKHSVIFLLETGGEYAVLQTSNSKDGQHFVAKRQRLKVSEAGLVGRVAITGEPMRVDHVALDHINVSDPEQAPARSELALPLQVYGKVTGVLQVLSAEPFAFSEEDTRILQLLAGQIALAIENSRLYQEIQHTARELDTLSGQKTHDAWRKRIGKPSLAFRLNALEVEAASSDMLQAEDININQPVILSKEDDHKLAVPIFLRDQLLGSMILHREGDQLPWTNEDLGLAQELSAQFATALENARLMETIQRHAQQERLVGQISAKAQRSLDLETVMKTSVQEIGDAFNARLVQIRILNEPRPAGSSGNGNSPTPEPSQDV